MSGTYCTFCGNKLIGGTYCNCYGIREAARKAEGPATKEPEQSPSLGSPSGAVKAAMKVFGDFTYEALRHHKERSTRVKEFHAATNLIWDALRSLPQAPATPAAAPSEGKEKEPRRECWVSWQSGVPVTLATIAQNPVADKRFGEWVLMVEAPGEKGKEEGK